MHDRYTVLVRRCIELSVKALMRAYIDGTIKPYVLKKETDFNKFVQRHVILEIKTECAINDWTDYEQAKAIENANNFFFLLEKSGKKIVLVPERKVLTDKQDMLDFT